MITVQKQQRYSTETQQNCNWVTKQSKAKKHKRPNLENVTPVIFRLLFITQVWMNPKMMYRLLGCENGIVVGGVQNTGRGRFDGQHHSLLCKDLQIIEQNMLSPIALPVPFHIFSVLLLLVNTTSLLNPTSLAFMTASTMTSWPTKGWNMHSSYCNLQRAWLLLHFWPQKEYPLLLYFLFLILVVLMRSCLPLSFPHCFLCNIPWTSHYKLFHNWMEECSNPM